MTIRWRSRKRSVCALALACFGVQVAAAQAGYPDEVLADKPVAYWRLSEPANVANDDQSGAAVSNFATGTGSSELAGAVHGVGLGVPGPRPPQHLDFEADNTAAAFDGHGVFIRIKDPGEKSAFDFDAGDSITLEAWVNPSALSNNQQIYIVGKGRTGNPGAAQHNQNWSLRLRGEGGTCRASFLFRDRDNRPSSHPQFEEDWHRWTSDAGFAPGTGWHHVVISYTFGKAESIRGYIDGVETGGAWDMGGPSSEAPVVDNDEVWLGSSMGGNPSSTFQGMIDEVAVYRSALSPQRIAARYNVVPGPPAAPRAPLPEPPRDHVLVELIENVPDERGWKADFQPASLTFDEPAFGLPQLPKRYNDKGILSDWSNPLVLRAASVVALPAGEHKLLLRAYNGARLSMDGKVIASIPFKSRNASGHDPVPEMQDVAVEGMRMARPGHVDQVVAVRSDGGEHVFVLEAFIGGKNLRPEVGEVAVGLLPAGASERMFTLLAPSASPVRVAMTDEGWMGYVREREQAHHAADARRRREAGAAEAEYWAMRHKLAREHMASLPPIETPKVSAATPVHNDIDRFIGARLEEANIKPAPLADDWTFARRVSLDITGVSPDPQLLEEFMRDVDSTPAAQRRARLIDRLLENPRWADNWVGYWQDVLAENPGMLKPMLNNTGPFRWWVYESLLDNKPFDRFASELVMMEGSKFGGGPAGFEMASQNDVPFAAKAHTLGQAFLAMNMGCARCHDAPFHDFKQQDLFSLAAMLKRGEQQVPATSSVPGGKDRLRKMIIEVTLEPGSKVKPDWPFAEELGVEPAALAAGVVRKPKDSREMLTALLTAPQNERFAQVIVNRMWRRYLGYGIVEPVDDWEGAKPSHPQLLGYLARELANHEFDLKHVARLIFNSHTYQRAVRADAPQAGSSKAELFASPLRRRLSAEQLVESLYAVAGKSFNSEELNMDVDGRRPVQDFLNLGTPTRAWQFTSLSNERDRPALAMPMAQSIIDVLDTFGWRQSRQNPLTMREQTATPLQPATVANSIVTKRITGLSDDSALTQLCLEDQPVDQLVRRVFVRILSRPPSDGERAVFVELLSDGYEQRRVKAPVEKSRAKQQLTAVSWSNHLSPEATKLKQDMERQARAGDPPTTLLQEDWRQRMEDMVWALINTPEFVFMP